MPTCHLVTLPGRGALNVSVVLVIGLSILEWQKDMPVITRLIAQSFTVFSTQPMVFEFRVARVARVGDVVEVPRDLVPPVRVFS